MNRFVLLLLAAFSAFIPPASGQMRTGNSGAPGVLRRWPLIGVWQTAMSRSFLTNDITCVMFTGYHNPNQGSRYGWGIRQNSKDTALEIADSNPSTVSGSLITVSIDGLTVGNYPVTHRVVFEGLNFIIADLPRSNAERLFNLIRLGGAIKFVTSTATYSASLWGAGASMMNFNACITEMDQLHSAQASAR